RRAYAVSPDARARSQNVGSWCIASYDTRVTVRGGSVTTLTAGVPAAVAARACRVCCTRSDSSWTRCWRARRAAILGSWAATAVFVAHGCATTPAHARKKTRTPRTSAYRRTTWLVIEPALVAAVIAVAVHDVDDRGGAPVD